MSKQCIHHATFKARNNLAWSGGGRKKSPGQTLCKRPYSRRVQDLMSAYAESSKIITCKP